jgi:hypothetical protein
MATPRPLRTTAVAGGRLFYHWAWAPAKIGFKQYQYRLSLFFLLTHFFDITLVEATAPWRTSVVTQQ